MKMVNQPNGAATSRNNSGQSKIIERMEDGMKNLTTIKTMEEAAILRYAEHMIQDMKLEKVGVVVTMNDGQAFLFPLMNAFQIHRCNEFLRSLNLGMDIEFYYNGSMASINQYAFLIENCMNALKVKRIMASLKVPDDITPNDVNCLILGRLSNKYKKNLIAEKVNHLEAYVREAVQMIKNERMVQA